MFLSEFISIWQGKKNVGNTDGNKGECVGLVSLWMDVFNVPHVWGHARDLYTNAPTTFFEKITNKPNIYPIEGDIVVWGKTWGGGFGHTGVVVSSDSQTDSFKCFEQNDPMGSTPSIKTRTGKDWNGLIGWLRPKGYQAKGTNTQIDELEKTIQELRTQREVLKNTVADRDKTIATERKDSAKTIKKLNDEIVRLNGIIETQNQSEKNATEEIIKNQTTLIAILKKLFTRG